MDLIPTAIWYMEVFHKDLLDAVSAIDYWDKVSDVSVVILTFVQFSSVDRNSSLKMDVKLILTCLSLFLGQSLAQDIGKYNRDVD